MKIMRISILSLIALLMFSCHNRKRAEKNFIINDSSEEIKIKEGDEDTLSKFLQDEGFVKLNSTPTFFAIDSLHEVVGTGDSKTTFISKQLKEWLDPQTKDLLYSFQYWQSQNLYFLLLEAYRGDLLRDFRLYIYNKTEDKIITSSFILTENDDSNFSYVFSKKSKDKIYRYHFRIVDFDNTSEPNWFFCEYFSERFNLIKNGEVQLSDRTELQYDTLLLEDFSCRLVYTKIKSDNSLLKKTVEIE